MNEQEARKILQEYQVEIAPEDNRLAVEIVYDSRLRPGKALLAEAVEISPAEE